MQSVLFTPFHRVLGIAFGMVLGLSGVLYEMGSRDWAYGMLTGVFLSFLNYVLWRFIVARFLGLKRTKAWLSVALLLLKLGVNTIAVFWALREAHLNPVAFMVGLSVGVVAILMGGYVDARASTLPLKR